MINEEIHASWDETSQFILISRVKHTRLQQLALTLAENVANAVEQNELTLNMKNPKSVSHLICCFASVASQRSRVWV